jgi:hypothetical protein
MKPCYPASITLGMIDSRGMHLDLPFRVPDFPWWGWVLIALGGVILADIVKRFETRFTSFLAVVIGVLAALCGLAGILVLLNS